MEFDNGEVIQGLDETWTFMGGTLAEWMAGLCVFFIISLFAPTPGRAMPFMLTGWVTTVIALASVRHLYPDQERGVRNAVMTSCGFAPPGIPTPAKLQPMWSSCPLVELSPNTKFVQLELAKLFPDYEQEALNEELKQQKIALEAAGG